MTDVFRMDVIGGPLDGCVLNLNAMGDDAPRHGEIFAMVVGEVEHFYERDGNIFKYHGGELPPLDPSSN